MRFETRHNNVLTLLAHVKDTDSVILNKKSNVNNIKLKIRIY
jgi:hypothetical protein